MTDSSLNTHTATSIQTTAGPLSSIPAHSHDRTYAPSDEVEDYIIKCICGFREDDGNTVYCDSCDTWQHTECYYIDKHGNVPTKEELEVIDHSCAECQPRSLNAKGAIERQRIRRKELDPGDRKVKKSTAKSHKKKIRGLESNGLTINGWDHHDQELFNDNASQSPRDQHPSAKRPKANHRVSHSMQLPVLSPNPNPPAHKPSGSTAHSPSKAHGKHSPIEYARDSYSVEFLSLYDNDPGDTMMQTNLLNDISITRDLSHWSRDIELLREATNGLSPQDVFNRCEQPLDSMPQPHLNKEYREGENTVPSGRRPRWTYLTIDSFTPKDSIVGELRGKIGHMQHYIQDPNNRWEYLRHPAPFVFFHPKLPIYIDTRSEGTICRYLRRSCDPNLSMKTFLENGSEYHFCFVAKKDLDAGTELTIGWVLDEHIRSFFNHRNQDEVKLEGDVNAGEDYVTDWTAKVLGEFGGCACNSSKCAFDRYDQRSSNMAKGREGYNPQQLQGRSNGCGTNSRASSEQDDGRSSSGSRSQSRDVTPTNNVCGETGFGVEISDREKRKIAALEKNFEQLENDKLQPAHKKKKRNSGGSNVNTPSAGTSVSTYSSAATPSSTEDLEQKQLGHTAMSLSQPTTPGLSAKPQYADAGTSRRKSGSPTVKSYNTAARPKNGLATGVKTRSSQPNTPSTPSALIRPNYVSTAMQTDRDDDDWYSPPCAPVLVKKPYISLTKRLLLRSQRDREKLEERRSSSINKSIQSNANGHSGSSAPPQMHEAAEMEYLGQPSTSAHAPTDTLLHAAPNTAELKPPPLWLSNGSQAANEQSRPTNGFRTNDLRVQLPLKPSVPTDTTSNTSLIETPTSTVPQSPFVQNSASYPPLLSNSSSSTVQPSPIKKKVSLNEYLSKLKGSQPPSDIPASSSPIMQHGTLRNFASLMGEAKDSAMHGSDIMETPREDHESLGTGESKDPNL